MAAAPSRLDSPVAKLAVGLLLLVLVAVGYVFVFHFELEEKITKIFEKLSKG